MAAKSLNGNKNIAPMILNTTPSVNPTMAKGSSNSHKKINKKNKPIAKGQQSENSMQNNNIAINTFMATEYFNYI